MIKFIGYNIKDPNIIGLIKKYLKAGIMDKGKYVATEEGSAQGNIISPVLANIYMHFVLVLWYKEIIEKRAEGENFLVVYADDFIAGFQYQREAEAYYEALKVWLYENRDTKVKELMEKLRIKLLGHYRYYGVSHNSTMIGTFRHRTIEYLFKVLNIRSNRKSYNWEGFNEMMKYYKLPYPKIYFSLFD